MSHKNSIKHFFNFCLARQMQLNKKENFCPIREHEFFKCYCFFISVFIGYNANETYLKMKKSEYNKIKNHLESKLNFYQNSLANSERKTNFHGKKFHRVNSFEAAIRIEEINFLLSYLKSEIKPESIFKNIKDFFVLKFKLFKIKIGFKNELDKIKI